MTGTERAALRLALGVLRRSITFGVGALSRPTVAGYAMASAAAVLFMPDGLRLSLGQCAGDDRRRRRARACLYIRAVLRAERGEKGAVTSSHRCWKCGGGAFRSEPWTRGGEMYCSRLDCKTPMRQPRPLWLDAPEHR